MARWVSIAPTRRKVWDPSITRHRLSSSLPWLLLPLYRPCRWRPPIARTSTITAATAAVTNIAVVVVSTVVENLTNRVAAARQEALHFRAKIPARASVGNIIFPASDSSRPSLGYPWNFLRRLRFSNTFPRDSPAFLHDRFRRPSALLSCLVLCTQL